MLTTDEILERCAENGITLSIHLLRSYVQRDLLPRSRRVGTKGKHKGSFGMYPDHTVDRIVAIKKIISETETTLDDLEASDLLRLWRCYDVAVEFDQAAKQLGKTFRFPAWVKLKSPAFIPDNLMKTLV